MGLAGLAGFLRGVGMPGMKSRPRPARKRNHAGRVGQIDQARRNLRPGGSRLPGYRPVQQQVTAPTPINGSLHWKPLFMLPAQTVLSKAAPP